MCFHKGKNELKTFTEEYNYIQSAFVWGFGADSAGTHSRSRRSLVCGGFSRLDNSLQKMLLCLFVYFPQQAWMCLVLKASKFMSLMSWYSWQVVRKCRSVLVHLVGGGVRLCSLSLYMVKDFLSFRSVTVYSPIYSGFWFFPVSDHFFLS